MVRCKHSLPVAQICEKHPSVKSMDIVGWTAQHMQETYAVLASLAAVLRAQEHLAQVGIRVRS
eukprot:2549205-Amphidinium_carterae.1